jgi:branched-chain amino acid aminotransferase
MTGTDASTVVWLDGRLRDPADAQLHWSDHGITVGDGVFETIKLVDGEPFALRRHLERLSRSAAGLGLGAPDDRVLRGAVDEVCTAWGVRAGRLRITVTGGLGYVDTAFGVEAAVRQDVAGASQTTLMLNIRYFYRSL